VQTETVVKPIHLFLKIKKNVWTVMQLPGMFQRALHSQDIPRKERPQAHRSVSRSHGYPQWLDEDPSATLFFPTGSSQPGNCVERETPANKESLTVFSAPRSHGYPQWLFMKTPARLKCHRSNLRRCLYRQSMKKSVQLDIGA